MNGYDFGEAKSRQYRWADGFTALQQYKAQHGDCIVPAQSEEHPILAAWVSGQRARMKAGKLTEQQIERLAELGFIVDLDEDRWDESYAALQQYKALHGDCNVPSLSEEHPILSAWVSGQRTRMKAGKLTEQQIERLAELGFIWDLRESNWHRMYQEFGAYKLQNERCWVPRRWPRNQRLASWVSYQRKARISGNLPQERITLLDAVGFNWKEDRLWWLVGSLHNLKWQQMFDELVKYKQQFKNCDIPMNWPGNPRLARWVSSQRTAKTNGKLPEYRMQLLDELGFLWQKKTGRPSLESNGDC